MNEQRDYKSLENQKSGKLMTVLLIIILVLFGAIMIYALDLG